MGFRVLVADSMAADGLAAFERSPSLELTNQAGISRDDLIKVIGDFDGLVVRSRTQVDADVLGAAKNLKVVGRAGIGVDNIDLSAATQAGIVVMNAPDGNATTTAEHTLSLMMSMSRRIPQATASMKAGKWEKKKFMGTELCGKTLGVLGLGNIGRIVADRAQGLKMKVVGFDPYFDASQAAELGIESLPLEEVVKRADFITVHTPLNDATRNMISDAQVELMKPGVKLINCARGGIYDEGALLRGLESGKIGGLALDVFAEEPPGDHPLVAHDQVVCTPHLGASTTEAQVQVAVDIAEQFEAFAQGKGPKNAVNMPRVDAKELQSLAPFLALAERLGAFIGQLAEGSISKIEVCVRGEIAAYNPAPITTSVLMGLLGRIIDRPVTAVNARLLAESRGVVISEARSSDRHLTYASTLEVKIEGGEGISHSVVGTLFSGDEGRVVEVDGARLEALPQGVMLLIRNHNNPGVIGQIGTILGASGVNISRMHLGLRGDEAISILNVDHPVPAQVIEQLQTGDVLSARQVTL